MTDSPDAIGTPAGSTEDGANGTDFGANGMDFAAAASNPESAVKVTPSVDLRPSAKQSSVFHVVVDMTPRFPILCASELRENSRALRPVSHTESGSAPVLVEAYWSEGFAER